MMLIPQDRWSILIHFGVLLFKIHFKQMPTHTAEQQHPSQVTSQQSGPCLAELLLTMETSGDFGWVLSGSFLKRGWASTDYTTVSGLLPQRVPSKLHLYSERFKISSRFHPYFPQQVIPLVFLVPCSLM